jgi:hypothetical protein
MTMTETLRCSRCHGTGQVGRATCRVCWGRGEREPGFFDDLPVDPMARANDRETVKAAAKSVDVNAREQEIIDALRFLTVASSTHDIQSFLEGRFGAKRDRNCIARRLTSLVRKGVVTDQGVKPGPYGRHVTAYRLTRDA